MADRAYGIEHQRIRRAMIADLPNLRGIEQVHPKGWLCPRCGKPMRVPPEPLDLGHSTEQRKRLNLPGDRLEHSTCNREAGASRPTAVGPSYTPSEDW